MSNMVHPEEAITETKSPFIASSVFCTFFLAYSTQKTSIRLIPFSTGLDLIVFALDYLLCVAQDTIYDA
jgi:hypothetical protein